MILGPTQLAGCKRWISQSLAIDNYCTTCTDIALHESEAHFLQSFVRI